MYKALVNFRDLQDNGYKYQAGDDFPRKGMKPSKERLEELLTDKNRRHKPMIEEVKEVPEAMPMDEPNELSEEPKPKPKPKKGGKKK